MSAIQHATPNPPNKTINAAKNAEPALNSMSLKNFTIVFAQSLAGGEMWLFFHIPAFGVIKVRGVVIYKDLPSSDANVICLNWSSSNTHTLSPGFIEGSR